MCSVLCQFFLRERTRCELVKTSKTNEINQTCSCSALKDRITRNIRSMDPEYLLVFII